MIDKVFITQAHIQSASANGIPEGALRAAPPRAVLGAASSILRRASLGVSSTIPLWKITIIIQIFASLITVLRSRKYFFVG